MQLGQEKPQAWMWVVPLELVFERFSKQWCIKSRVIPAGTVADAVGTEGSVIFTTRIFYCVAGLAGVIKDLVMDGDPICIQMGWRFYTAIQFNICYQIFGF